MSIKGTTGRLSYGNVCAVTLNLQYKSVRNVPRHSALKYSHPHMDGSQNAMEVVASVISDCEYRWHRHTDVRSRRYGERRKGKPCTEDVLAESHVLVVVAFPSGSSSTSGRSFSGRTPCRLRDGSKREWRVVELERATLLTYVKWVAKTRREGNQEAEEEEMKGMNVQDARHAVPVTAAVWAPIVDLATNMRSCLLELCSARHFEIGTLSKAEERDIYMHS
jgi:hypothetical protein